MIQKKPETKRKAGRPRLHDDTKLVQFRAPEEVADAIMGAFSALRLIDPTNMKTPFPVFLIEALKLRLRLEENRRPSVRVKINALDRVLEKNYGHVER